MSNLCEPNSVKTLLISLDLDYLTESDTANKFLKEVELIFTISGFNDKAIKIVTVFSAGS